MAGLVAVVAFVILLSSAVVAAFIPTVLASVLLGVLHLDPETSKLLGVMQALDSLSGVMVVVKLL